MRALFITRIRAYLIAASLSAVALDAPLVVWALLAHRPDCEFQSLRFRALASAYLLIAVAIVRVAARTAFRVALAGGHARYARCANAHGGDLVELRAACPAFSLVVLHLQFSGVRYRCCL